MVDIPLATLLECETVGCCGGSVIDSGTSRGVCAIEGGIVL